MVDESYDSICPTLHGDNEWWGSVFLVLGLLIFVASSMLFGCTNHVYMEVKRVFIAACSD